LAYSFPHVALHAAKGFAGRGSGTPELFDLEADPSERFNPLSEHSGVAARPKAQMAGFSARMASGPAFELTSRGKPKSQP
jgi:hypothetical protein